MAVAQRFAAFCDSASALFRTAKSDHKMRPIYHQKTERGEAHILVCFLALAQWRVLGQWMSGKGLGTCARKLITAISTIKSMEVIIPVKRGESSAELTVRTFGRPERGHANVVQKNEIRRTRPPTSEAENGGENAELGLVVQCLDQLIFNCA